MASGTYGPSLEQLGIEKGGETWNRLTQPGTSVSVESRDIWPWVAGGIVVGGLIVWLLTRSKK